MLDGSTMGLAPRPAHLSPLHTTVISGPAAADCRHTVCLPPVRRPELQIPTTLEAIPHPSTMLKAITGKAKLRGRTEDPCRIAPLKKRKIQVCLSYKINNDNKTLYNYNCSNNEL